MPKQTTVRIDNPLPGGSSYTSAKNALRFIRREMAEFSGPASIRFIERDVRVAKVISAERRLIQRDLADDQMIAKRIGGRLPWNGCDIRDKAFHLPFTAQAFPAARMRIPVQNEMRP